VFVPTTFASLGVPRDLVTCLERQGITEPYPIQSATLPDTLSGRDLLAQSPTGSGKTLAFAIPVLSRVSRSGPRRPRGLVLAPTRELAAQIAEVFRPLAHVVNRRVATFYGGTGYRDQLRALDRGVDVAIGCPGRLIDLVERGALKLADVEVVVVDEADRMADMGFLPAVRRLLGEIARAQQTMLFSATLTREVEHLVAGHQRQPVRHVLAQPADDLGSRSHEFWRVAREDRTAHTARLVATVGSSIVFCRTKHGADRLARQLAREGLDAVAIHGDRSQPQRDRALARFRAGRAQVLVGTDVAARGLHVDGVDCVVHFDPPGDEDTYLHRSGRTGRAGATGRVVSLITPEHEHVARAFERRFGSASDLDAVPDVQGASGEQAQRPLGTRKSRGTSRRDATRAARPLRAGEASHAGRPAAANPRRQRLRGKAASGQRTMGRNTSRNNRQRNRRAS
jgi:superfamily II DNA/RNA helicase